MTTEILDKPEEKRLAGIDLKINRYHIINPDNGELMITELRSTGISWIFIFIACGLVGAGLCFAGYKAYTENDSLSGLVVASAFGLFFIFIGCFAIFKQFFSKEISHFTTTELIETGTFGKKRFFARDKVKSVFIHETKRYENGRYKGSDFAVCLRIPGYNREDHYVLLNVSNEDTSKNNNPLIPFKYSAESQACAIANTVANHWNIPLSV
jgi:hypothetical protein